MPKWDLGRITVRRVEGWNDLQDFMAWLSEDREWLGFDTETTGLNVAHDYIRFVQFGDTRAAWGFDYPEWKSIVKEVFATYRGRMVAHNLLFDWKMLAADGIHIPAQWAHDSMIQAHILNPLRSNALKPLATKLLDPRASFGAKVLDQVFSAAGWNWKTVPRDHPAYWIYGCMDTSLCAMLAEELWPQIESNYRYAYDIELGAIRVLRDAELAGMPVDLDYIKLATAKLETEIAAMAPHLPCNPNAPGQVVSFLLSRGATLFERTASGNLKADDEVLGFWAENGIPEAGMMVQYRKKVKLLSSYFNNLTNLVSANNTVHCNIRTCAAKTSRMSVTDPALQTLPRGRDVRDAFIAGEGHKLLSADYSQMELAVMAHFANEESMIEAFQRGEDLHSFVARSLYGPNFTKAQRQICKNGQFAKIYGAGIEKLAITAKVPVEVVAAFMDQYDSMFPGVKRWQESVIQTVQGRAWRSEPGWVDILGGRRLPVPAKEAYKGCNYEIQGSCAQVTKLKLIELDNAGIGDYIRLPIHDEILFIVPDEEVAEVKHIIDTVMPDTHSFRVPIRAEADIYDRWGQKYHDEWAAYLPEYLASVGDPTAWDNAEPVAA